MGTNNNAKFSEKNKKLSNSKVKIEKVILRIVIDQKIEKYSKGIRICKN